MQWNFPWPSFIKDFTQGKHGISHKHTHSPLPNFKLPRLPWVNSLANVGHSLNTQLVKIHPLLVDTHSYAPYNLQVPLFQVIASTHEMFRYLADVGYLKGC